VAKTRLVSIVMLLSVVLLLTGSTGLSRRLTSAADSGHSWLALPVAFHPGEPDTRVVSCLGNSVTHGYPYVGSESTYPARLQTSLDSAHGPGAFAVINHGVTGYRADQVLSSLRELDWMDEDPDIVLLMVGGNDFLQEAPVHGVAATVNRTVAEVQAIVDLIKAHVNRDGSTPRVIVSAFIPNLLLEEWGSGAMALYNTGLEANLTDIDLWTTDNWDDFYDAETEQARAGLMVDPLHPNIEGYRIIAENCYAAIEILLSSGTTFPPGTGAPLSTVEDASSDEWSLWSGQTRLRGANIYQRRVYPELDGETFMGPGSVGPPYTQEDMDRLSGLGANYVNISHPGLFTETPPYRLNEDVQSNLDDLLRMIERADMFAVISFRTGPGRSEFTFHLEDVGDWFDQSYLNDQVWVEETAQAAWAEMWKHTARRYRDNAIVVGYDLMVEPNSNEVWLDEWDPEQFYANHAGSLYDWNQFFPTITEAIREVDAETPILIGGMAYSAVDWLPYVEPTNDERTVYMVHQYAPFAYTHQDPGGGNSYPGVFDTDWDGTPDQFNRSWLDGLLSTVDEFVTRHGVPVAVNEFGVVRWVPNAASFMTDQTTLFEQRGMNHALWLWEVSWTHYADEVDAFNFRHGPDPASHTDIQDSDLIRAIKTVWSRNTLRPSSEVFQVYLPLVAGS